MHIPFKYKIFTATFVVIVLALLLYKNGSNRNSINIYKIKKGMNVYQVCKIMGIPQKTSKHHLDSARFYYMYKNYELGSSDDFYVYFTSTDSFVTYINYGN
jgi:outer membrane protein assembly factor BamE (lipoprotein component of BamABCDE complex)